MAIKAMEKNPLIGHKYDGEMLVALSSIDSQFWQQHQDDGKRVLSMIGIAMVGMDEETRRDAMALARNIQCVR